MDLVMDLDRSPTTLLEIEIKLEGTYPMHNSGHTMELHNSTHEVIGVILPETTHSTLVVDDRSIDIRISSLTGMMTISTGMALPSKGTWQNIGTNPRSPSGPRRGPQPSRQYQPSQSSTPGISVLGQSNGQESGSFVPMSTDSRKRKTNLALTQCDSPQRKIQSICYPTSARETDAVSEVRLRSLEEFKT